MSSGDMEPEAVFWETEDISQQEVWEAIDGLRDDYGLVVLEEYHDVTELLEFYELTDGTGKPTGAVSETKLEQAAERFEEHFEAVQKAVTAVVEREEAQMELLQERRLDAADAGDVAEAKELCREQQKAVEDLAEFMAEREEMLDELEELLPSREVSERYDELVHEPFVDFTHLNPEVVLIALKSGYMILHSAHLLSEMDTYERARDAAQRSREALEQAKAYLDEEAPGEAEIDPDNEDVYTLLDKIEEAKEDDD